MAKIRVALPGYNALTDTDIDHYSLYSDIDNVLIKRKITGSQTVTSGGAPTKVTVYHNLGYIPFFMVYYDCSYYYGGTTWAIVNNQYNAFEVPEIIAGADTEKINIWSYSGTNINVSYDIFYDNMSSDAGVEITESETVFKVARPGKNALQSKNPNDYIVHSDLNNFKILKQGKIDTTIPSSTDYVNISHGFTGTTPYKYFCFVKMPDGKTLLTGHANQYSYNEAIQGIISTINTNYITVYANVSSDTNVSVAYFIYGTATNGMIEAGKARLAVAKSGSNVLTETNPDNFNFHSDFPTLKYYLSGSYTMTVSQTTTYSIYHGLGYVPFFIGFVNDIAGTITDAYAIAPYWWGRSTIWDPNKSIGAFVYADSNYLYLKAYYQPNAVGLQKTFTFYYKIFKNNLGL